MSKVTPPHEAELEALAMNIIHQTGDALYDALPKDVAHDHFVTARQVTNDRAIDFTKKLINAYCYKQVMEALTDIQTKIALLTWGGPNGAQASHEIVSDAIKLRQAAAERFNCA